MTKNLLLFAIILLVIVGIAYFTFSNVQSQRNRHSVEIHGNKIQLEIADTSDEQMRGLSGRKTLAENRGMLFVFEKPGIHSFWMKDMRFPIDIIFLNGEKVVTIHHNVQPSAVENTVNLSLYTPKDPADKVIEINGGLAKRYNLKEGNILKIEL